jgi:hypothetical protein
MITIYIYIYPQYEYYEITWIRMWDTFIWCKRKTVRCIKRQEHECMWLEWPCTLFEVHPIYNGFIFRKVYKKANKIIFSNDDAVLIADKFGDVYRMDENDHVLLYGCVSMNLDLVLYTLHIYLLLDPDKRREIPRVQWQRRENQNRFVSARVQYPIVLFRSFRVL